MVSDFGDLGREDHSTTLGFNQTGDLVLRFLAKRFGLPIPQFNLYRVIAGQHPVQGFSRLAHSDSVPWSPGPGILQVSKKVPKLSVAFIDYPFLLP